MTTADQAAQLRAPFDKSEIGTRPQGGTQLSYVGHAAVTNRLLQVDPDWSWEPMGLESTGLPAYERDGQGQPIGLWIKLTVCDVTRLGYGDAGGKQGGNAVKEMIGDALRNAAMRFGVALDLWSKGDLSDKSERVAETRSSVRPETPRQQTYLDELMAVTTKRGYTREQVGQAFTAWHDEHLPVMKAPEADVREFTALLDTGEVKPDLG